MLGYEAHAQEVVDFHNSNARRRIVSAPARTSKSWAAAHDAIPDGLPELVEHKGKWVPKETKLSWSVGPTYDTNKEFDYWWDNLVEKKLLEGMGASISKAQNSPQQGNMVIVAEWGRGADGRIAKSIYEGKSSTNERALQGEQVNGACIMSEAADQPEKIWAKYLSTRSPNAIFPTTPKVAAEWLHRMIEQGDDGAQQIAHFTFSPKANPQYDYTNFWSEHAIAEARAHGTVDQDAFSHECLIYDGGSVRVNPVCRAATDPDFAEQFLGQWTFREGRILPFLWKPGLGQWCNVVEDDPAWPVSEWFWSFDYGYTHAYVGLLWRVDPVTGTAVITDSFYESKMNDDDVSDRIMEIEARNECTPRWYVADPKRPEVGDLLVRRGFPVFPLKKSAQSDRAATHKALVNALSPDPRLGHPRLFIHARNTEVIREWKSLHTKTRTGNEWGAQSLGKQDDHAFDAARYGVVALDLLRPKNKHRSHAMREIAEITRSVRDMAPKQSIPVYGGFAA